MEDNTNSSFFTFGTPNDGAPISFEPLAEEGSIIKVIGVGGGGGNAVNHMYQEGIKGVDFIVCNTDKQALSSSPVPTKLSIGVLGAGNDPAKGRAAALQYTDAIRNAIAPNTQMLFITAGMGGGTGTGASPVIAEIAKSIVINENDDQKMLVVAVVTIPFDFEGKRRLNQAAEGIKELSQHVDSIIVINNEKLHAFGNMTMSQGRAMADDVLLNAVKSIAEIITNNAIINIDFQDVYTVMSHSGTALMGAGSGRGEGRARHAIEEATTSVLLNDNDIRGAKNVLLYFSCSQEHEITMDEQKEITDYILDCTGNDTDFIWGAGFDDSLGDELRVIFIATGFDKKNTEIRKEILAEEEPTNPAPKNEQQPTDNNEPHIVVKPSPNSNDTKREDPFATTTQPKPEQPTPKEEKHIFILDEFAEAEQPQKPIAQQPTKTESDPFADSIKLLNQMPSPKASTPVTPTQVAPEQPKNEEPSPSTQGHQLFGKAFQSDVDVATAADRIRHIHDLLRNTPGGADIVQNMTTQQIADGNLYVGAHSSEREAPTYTLNQNGLLSSNPYAVQNGLD